MKKNRKIILLIVILLVLAASVLLSRGKEKVEVEESPYLNSTIEVKTFQGEKGWGYEITIDGELYVYQPNIPALPGDSGFENEADAQAVAEIMVEKIRKNILPPGVTEEEVRAVIEQ